MNTEGTSTTKGKATPMVSYAPTNHNSLFRTSIMTTSPRPTSTAKFTEFTELTFTTPDSTVLTPTTTTLLPSTLLSTVMTEPFIEIVKQFPTSMITLG